MPKKQTAKPRAHGAKPLKKAAKKPVDKNNYGSEYKIDLDAFYRNISEGIAVYSEILKSYASKIPMRPSGNIDPLNVNSAFFDAFQKLAADPDKVFDSGVELYRQLSGLWLNSAQAFLQKRPVKEGAKSRDKRFRDGMWEENPYFKFLKDAYLVYAEWLLQLTRGIEGMDKKSREKLEFYTSQFIDAISPSNFLFTNPEVLRATLETNAENLVHGLKNLAHDIAQGNITQTGFEAFELGKNIATTPGKVVFQNELFQLIQYEPVTKDVYKTPLLFIPAWINKYYIADLKPENSLVKWLVEHGYTLFMVSWVNPDSRHKNKDFADYVKSGLLTAVEQVCKITGEDKLNAIGYCLGGTLLATTLAYMDAKKDKRINSATFLTTMLDFSEAGNLSIFIDDEQLAMLEKRMSETGYLDGREMALTFSMLRANDLIWSFVVNNYLLGKDPLSFDLLYWNSDSTRMPAKMHSFYLRNMYLKNLLAKPGGIEIDGVKIDLRKIRNPAYFLSTLKDHIAPWKSTYKGAALLPNSTFVLADSGHIAGVVNPPSAAKYPHWINGKLNEKPDGWLKHAKEEAGSWWPNWHKWNINFTGSKVPARKIGKSLEDAPGSYVKVRT